MKSILYLALALFTLCTAEADGIPGAKAEFAKLVEYQKTDDIRSLDLFAEDCRVVFKVTDGREVREAAIPPDAWREMLRSAIAQKKGNRDEYRDVKYVKEGEGVRLTANVAYRESGKQGPFSLLYQKDAKGVLRIREMKVTTFVTKLPPAAPRQLQ